ncbi:MAG: hypothetical protein WCJ94_01050 [bacterium]
MKKVFILVLAFAFATTMIFAAESKPVENTAGVDSTTAVVTAPVKVKKTKSKKRNHHKKKAALHKVATTVAQ